MTCLRVLRALPGRTLPSKTWRLWSIASAFELASAICRRPFGVREDVLALRVEGELRTRLSTSLLWMQGSITCTEAQRRFRGRAVPQSFDARGPNHGLFRLQGHGELALALAGYAFTQLPFAEESAYLLEDVLFRFRGIAGLRKWLGAR